MLRPQDQSKQSLSRIKNIYPIAKVLLVEGATARRQTDVALLSLLSKKDRFCGGQFCGQRGQAVVPKTHSSTDLGAAGKVFCRCDYSP